MAKKSRGVLVAGLSFGLAAGLALGVYVLEPNLAGGSNEREAALSERAATAEQRSEIAEAQAKSADSFIEAMSTKAVAGTLDKRPVLVIAADGAQQSDIDGVRALLKAAGAVDSGLIKLTPKFFSQDGADGLKNIVANTLPAGAQLSAEQRDAGTHVGESLGSALMLNAEAKEQATSEERAIILGSLRSADYIDYQDGTILPAQAVVIIGGDSDGSQDEFGVANTAAFVRAIDSRGSGAVYAARIQQASDTGVIGKLRDNALAREAVSTVDSVDRTWGQVATVLAVKEQLGSKAGAYGAAASAEAVSPQPVDAEPSAPAQ